MNVDRASELQRELGLDRQARGQRRRWLLGLGVLVLLLAGVVLWWLWPSGSSAAYQYKTAEVVQGDLTITVSATGNLQPVNQVDIGSEISGTIKSVDVDFNDQVQRGQVLLRFDTEQLQARLVQARASLQAAEAKLQEAKATRLESELHLKRVNELVKQQLAAPEDRDAAKAAFARAQAQVANTQAQVALARAALQVDESNLEKAVLRAPIDGVVLERKVEPGQTVAASFQTPVLLTIAEDLRQMELQVAVDEADVGQVAAGQPATFSVDAHPGRSFSARILKLHYAPVVVQDVVTYEALLSVDNADLLLRPGMTATADIVVNEIHDALLVPNAALRFSPPKTTNSTNNNTSFLRALLPGPPRRATKERKTAGRASYQVWTLHNGQPLAIPVSVGASDGRMTQIIAGELQPGMELLVDVLRQGR